MRELLTFASSRLFRFNEKREREREREEEEEEGWRVDRMSAVAFYALATLVALYSVSKKPQATSLTRLLSSMLSAMP